SGRIRLAKLIEDKRRYIQPFVLANTAPGCAIYTDANRSYVGIPDRKHFPTNLSAKDARPAHESFERIHRVFSNLKRWGLGTFHGFREKHLDAYLHEFEFRWNRRRRFRSTLDTLLGIGQSLPRTTYRDIVGDTSEWRQAHKEQILAMVSLERREAAKHLARVKKIDILDALEMVGPIRSTRPYKRRLSERPVLAPRRRGEERSTARYRHPPRPPMIAMANVA
ncbi:MAG: IS1595 family transposase, partial [Rhizobiales bacterium]|nr:IS1595 family transposase [Hyphomicrobiales bacterium]